MSISIVSCPKCHTFLLSDTAQCHRCRYVINPTQAAQFRDASLPSDAAIQQDSERCRQCGETYRKGLVRCWSCGAFTRPEIEDAYYRLLQGHAQSVNAAGKHYELPEISQEDILRQYQAEDMARQPVQTQEVAAMDEDFELTGNLRLLDDRPTSAEVGPIPLIPAATNGTQDSPAKSAAEPNGAKKTEMARPETPPADETASLMDHAREEQSAAQKARRARLGDGFVIFCPMGCKIRVQERHRGKIGRCPKCQSTFVVPMARQTSISGAVPPNAAEGAVAATAAASGGGGKFDRWMQDVHLHKVVPQKLRIKADSLLKDFQPVDIGFDAGGMLLAGLPAPKGMFAGKNAKKIEEDRAAIQTQMRTTGSSEGLPASFKQDFTTETVAQIAMSQPSQPGAESLFGDIPVFGAGRIAVRLPKYDDKTTSYLSFTLSEFRQFAQHLAAVYGIENFGAGCGIPMTDTYKTEACHLSKNPVKDLQNLAWYQKDPAFKLEVTGYRCKTCAAVISEGARAAQKLGGANGKAIAKAKCPKCTKPLGSQPLYVVPAAPAAASAEASEPETEESAAMTENQPEAAAAK